ncbi:retinoic acid-induced protein 1 isoform X1 [Poecilia latipinna]|nr:PREDICTED: retinoic acid-induced protein 1-like isoform X1 [Poecilia latipinna]XP_014916072.1 PREDICTED: retinoic acid-induced protein 1-like isoform X1 [Poecilia latipinna]
MKLEVVMEQPPGTLAELQHQGASSPTRSSVIDLTRKDDEHLLTSPSLDALQRLKGSGWGPNSGSAIPGLQLSDTGSSDVTVRPGDQIQPDNALSHTTVTLSYVSRSHVFSTHSSPPYSVSPISKSSFHPQRNTDNRFEETSYALNQHFLEQDKEPVNLVTHAEPFPSLSQPQVGPQDNAREYNAKEPPKFNGEAISSNGIEKKVLAEEKHSILSESRNCVENGRYDGWSEILQDEVRGTSDVLFIGAKKQDQEVSKSGSSTDVRSVNREYKSPLEDPVSPPSTSVDNVEDVFLLPQASSSPSADDFYLEAADDAGCSDRTTRASSAVNDGPRLESRDESKSHRRKGVLEPLIDLTDDSCLNPENKASCAIRHINGSANVLERTIKERKLPMRSGRGTRLEAIVMNINSCRYKVSSSILANKKPSASQPVTHTSALPRSKRKVKGKAKTAFSLRTVKRKAVNLKKNKPSSVDAQSYNDSTSVSESLNKTETSGTPAKRSRFVRPSRKPARPSRSRPVKSKTKPPSQSSAQFPTHKNLKEKPELVTVPEPSVEVTASKVVSIHPPPKSPKNSQVDPKSKTSSPTKKTKTPPKRRRKKPRCSQPSSMFSPKEPEIKLKYITYKEEKKDVRLDSFSPFVRVKRQQSSPPLCTIVNYPEDVKTEPKHQQQAHSSRFVSAVVPTTSCLYLGRLSTHGQHQRALVCCLCGRSANSIDLGDLHGPYYPEGYRPNTKAPANVSGLKDDEEDSSYSDSSSSTTRARRWAAPLKQKGLLGSRKWSSGRISSPAAKRARSDGGLADAEDWYSPPVLPVEPCEYWLHEDCGIWSAGVFLVRGKVYGLEEAVKVAQETMCSACHNPGATLGCFFKGCPNKYHYRCALESDCVLVEDNFSMKCKKHKNKTLKAPPGSRWDDR